MNSFFYSKEFDMSIHEIEQAIAELSPDELARFREWFDEFERDAKSGKLDKLADKAKSDFRAGKTKEV